MKDFQMFDLGMVILILYLIPSNFAFGQLEFSYMFGKEGTEMTHFKHPAGIALDKNNKIYIADFYNQRIQIWDVFGKFNSSISINGLAHGIEINDEKIYVAVWGDTPHIEIFNQDGTKIHSFECSDKPGDIAVNNSGEIYVTSYGTGVIQIFNSSGNILKTISPVINGISAKHTGITLDSSDNIYVTDYINDRVLKLDPSGNILLEFIVPIEEGGKFYRPTNIEINSKGDVFVTDNSNRLLVFNSIGNFKYVFGESGQGTGQFEGPHGIAFDDLEYVYIAEMNNHRIQVFNTIDSLQISSNNNTKLDNHINIKLNEYVYLPIPIIIIVAIWLIFKKYHSK